MHGTCLVSQSNCADRDRLDDALVLFAEVNDVTDRDLVLNEDEETRDDVLDEGLAAETDRDPDNPCAG